MAEPNSVDLVQVQRDGPVLVVVNNNPGRRNALSPEFYRGFSEALDRAERDPEIASVIVTGAGGFFCAGGDLNVLQKRREMSFEDRQKAIENLHELIRKIRACPKPVIASVEGGAAGAGVSTAFACDLVVCARDAKFTVAYVKVGLTPDGGATAFLSEALPRQLVSEMCLLGDPVEAERLAAAGAINLLTDPGKALEEAKTLAMRLSEGPEQAIARIKSLVSSAQSSGLSSQLDRECAFMAESLGGAEAAEGTTAFLDKRKPDYVSLRKGNGDGH